MNPNREHLIPSVYERGVPREPAVGPFTTQAVVLPQQYPLPGLLARLARTFSFLLPRVIHVRPL
jgi:hypothetical protein